MYYSTSSTTGYIWPMWVTGLQAYTVGTAGTASDVWPVWIQDVQLTTTATAATTNVWPEWVLGHNWYRYENLVNRQLQQIQPQLQQYREEVAERATTAAKERQEASERATALLREHLDESQRSSYDLFKEFLVKCQSGKVYRIKKGISGNVNLLNDDGVPIIQFCIHPDVSVPAEDNMLAQKLLLETDEKGFCRIANKTQLVHA